MGSGSFLKSIINLKKGKNKNTKRVKGSSGPLKSNGFKWKNRSAYGNLDMPIEDLAAIRIQTAFRGYKARKSLRRLKGTVRLQILTQKHSVTKQATTTLSYLHKWSGIQSEIKARRSSMVRDGRLKQKNLENQLKLETKLHDVEVDWCGGPEAKEEILTRIHQREEASIKRERTLAYAFAHQWRANSNPLGLYNYELGKASWGWSWVERWIASRPWEVRVRAPSVSSKEVQNKQATKVGNNAKSQSSKKQASPTAKKHNSPAAKKQVSPTVKKSVSPSVKKKTLSPSVVKKPLSPSVAKKPLSPSVAKKPLSPSVKKPVSPSVAKKPLSPSVKKPVSTSPKRPVSVKKPLRNGKGVIRARRLTYPGAEKPVARKESVVPEEKSEKTESME